MKFKKISMPLLIYTMVLTMMGCQVNQAVSPLDNPPGNVTGKLCDASGVPVKDATVYLIPEGYSILSDENRLIDSTTSNGLGLFGFQVNSNGKYNLLAKSNNRHVFLKLIQINADSQFVLPEERMLEGGALKITVQMESVDNHNSSVILFPGTNIYAVPSDSTGSFLVQNLPQGTYAIRLLSMKEGYDVIDTTVSIISGKTTTISPIQVKLKRSPKIENFLVLYDSLMMEAVLSWTCKDTDLVDSFRIYCNRDKNIFPVKTLDKSSSSVTFDLLSLSPQSYTYQISALRRDGWEGPSVSANPIVNKSGFCSKIINLPGEFQSLDYNQISYCHINKYGFYILRYLEFDGSQFQILMLNDSFASVKTVNLPILYTHLCSSVCSDGEGNIFIFNQKKSGNYRNIIRFDKDLNIIDSLSVPINEDMPYYSMAAASNGYLLLYNTSRAPFCEGFQDQGNATTTIERIYDNRYNLLSERVHNDIRTIMDSWNNGELTKVIMQSDSMQGTVTITLDQYLNYIKEDGSAAKRGSFEELYRTGICSDNLFFSDIGSYPFSDTCVLYLYTNREVVARYPHQFSQFMPLYSGKGLFSNYHGKLYSFGNGSVQEYTLEKISDSLMQ